MGKAVRTAFLYALVLVLSLGVGLSVFSLASMHYTGSEIQGPYDYSVEFGEGIEAKDLGVVVSMNLSFEKIWFVGQEKNVTLEVSAERVSGLVQNISWRVFWIRLFAIEEGRWKNTVAHGSAILDAPEWSATYLYKHLSMPVDTVNLSYWESVGKAWFGIEIMMSALHNNTEYSFTFHTPRSQIGPVAVLSPLYSPISLATFSTATTALFTTLTPQLLRKRTLVSKRKALPSD